MRRLAGLGTLIILGFMTTHVWGQKSAAQGEGKPVPRLIRFSGVVRQIGEKPARGVAELSFSLFKEEVGGEPLWFESQTVEVDAQGRYNVLLGAMHADGLPMDLFTSGEARWLSIMVGKAEQPRVLLVSVPYALKAADAESLGGKPATAFVATEQLKEQVASAMSDPKIGLRTLNTMVMASSGGTSTPPALVNETVPATFACSVATNCVAITQSGAAHALFSQMTATTGAFYGVYGVSASSSGRGVFGHATSATGTTYGVRGLTASTNGYGLYGAASAATGVTHGVAGTSASTSGRGIFGDASAATGATFGLFGQAASVSGVGLQGSATAGSGVTTGVRAVNFSPAGTAAIFDNLGGGKLISARTTGFVEKFAVDGNGNVAAGGTVTATSFVGIGSGLTGVGDILGITTAAGSGLQGGATTGTPSLSLLATCGGNEILKFISATWQCAVDNVTVSPSALIRGINYLAGCDTCTALADTDDQQDFYVNVIGPLNIQSVVCYTDGGTPSINVLRDDGTAANILSSNLSCTTGGATGTINTSEDDIAVNEKLDFAIVSAGGAKRITLVIKATL